MLKPSNYLRHFWFGVVCLGPVPSAAHLLLALVVHCFGWPVPVRFSFGFLFLLLRAPLSRCCGSVFCCGCRLVVVCPCGFRACGLARSLLASLPSPWLSPVFSGPVSVLLVPPSGYLVVFATVRLSYLWYGVSWLIGSCLHSASWQQRLRPCVGLCPLHHVVGVVHVPLAPSLRYSPSCDPEYPSDTAKAARARLFGLCCFLPPVLLPSRASALSFLDGLRLSPSPAPSFCWALSARLVVLCLGWCLWLLLLCGLGLSSWRVCFGFVCFVVRPWLVSLFVFCFWWLLLTPFWSGTLVLFAFTCTTQASIIIGLVCLSADWTGSLVLLTFTGLPCRCFVLLCDYSQSTEVTKDG